ncbi:helix-turn-helix transcriptional regulator [Veillonella criceti]|uniref:Multiple antibiotic resistance protein marA n=1 Tax=Veillonella criceti TaxID=103891 RepID=A0A380NBN8_9FIRM|nr:AraC family transcriptional regulator [Veillonella criceti]SUP37148.1 Multiple antibiotic resistance protein marA [Veillonella criceti]
MQVSESIRDHMQDSGTQLLEVWQNQKIYERKEASGHARMISRSVFDGIDIVYNDVVMEEIHHNAKPIAGLFEIHFCQDGRIECSFENGKCLYMNGGDISLGWKSCDSFRHSSYFPTGFYKGLSLAVYVPKAQLAVDAFVGKNSIDLEDICNRFCAEGDFGLVKDTGRLKELFMDLYKIPDCLPDVYLRVKCVEIFVLLGTLTSVTDTERIYFERGQVDTIKQVHDELIADLGNHHTIEALAERHRISMTALKRCFKGVYGITIYQYVKRCRMRLAAKDLVESNDTILSIANRWGYENGSKFSGAFKQIMGCNPREYRMKNKMS